MTESWKNAFAKKSPCLFLIVAVATVLSLVHCCKPSGKGYAVSTTYNALSCTTGMVYTVSYNGASVDTNEFANVVKAGVSALK